MGFFGKLFTNKEAETFDNKFKNSTQTLEEFIKDSTNEDFNTFTKNYKDIKKWKIDQHDLTILLLKNNDDRSLTFVSNKKINGTDEAYDIFENFSKKNKNYLNNFLNNNNNIKKLIDYISHDKNLLSFFKELDEDLQISLLEKFSENKRHLINANKVEIEEKIDSAIQKLKSSSSPCGISKLDLEKIYFLYLLTSGNKNAFKKCLKENYYKDNIGISSLIIDNINKIISPFKDEIQYYDFLNKFEDELAGPLAHHLVINSSAGEKWVKKNVNDYIVNKYGEFRYRDSSGYIKDREVSSDEAANNIYFLISLIRLLDDGDSGMIYNWWLKKMTKNHPVQIFSLLQNTIVLNKQEFSTEYFKNFEKDFLPNFNSYLLLILSFIMKDNYIYSKVEHKYSEKTKLMLAMDLYANPLKQIKIETDSNDWIYVEPIIDVSTVYEERTINYFKSLLTPEKIKEYDKKNPYLYALENGDFKGFNTLLNEYKYPDMIEKDEILQALGNVENNQDVLDFVDNCLAKNLFDLKEVIEFSIIGNSEYIFNHVYHKIENPKEFLTTALNIYNSYFFTKIIEKIKNEDDKNEIKTILLNSIENAILMNFDLHLEYIYNNTGEDFYKKDKQMNFIKIALQNKKEFALQFFIDKTNLLEKNMKYFNDYYIEAYRNELYKKLTTNRCFFDNCSYNQLFTLQDISSFTFSNQNKTSLWKFKDLIVNNVYVDIIYDLVEGDGQISNENRKTINEYYKQEVEVIDHKNNVYTLRLYSESEESKMIKNLKINNKEVSFFDLQNISGFKYIYFRYIPGVTIDDWINEKNYIEDYLGTQIEIEKYDESNILYDPEFSKENLIVIKESMISSIPKILNITGKYLKTYVDNGYNKYFFKDIIQSEWEDKIEEVSKILNSSLTISFERGIAILTEKVEAVIPKLLELKDSNGNIPIFQKIKEGEGFKTFYYSFLPELDLQQWKDRSKKTNFRSLFNEMDKVYELGVYNKSSKDYDPNFSTQQFITLTEYDAIPTKEELIDNKLSQDTLTNNEIFMGYGKGRKKYEIDLNTLSHLAVVGSTGSGKSNLMNGIITSLLYNLNNIDKLYLMDLKGTEFVKYEDVKSDKIILFTKKAKPSMILDALLEIEAEMHLRTAYCQKQRKPKLTTNPIYFVIDEFKQIDNIYCETSKDHNDKDEIYKALSRIGSLSRSSNIKLIIQTQGSKDIPEDIRKHCMSRILMKTGVDSDRDIHLQNPDKARELGINHLEFDKGRYILEDDNDGDTIVSELQFPFVDPYDNLHLEFQNEYNNTMSNEFQISLNEFIPQVKEEYMLLKNVSRLNPNSSKNEIVKKEEVSKIQNTTNVYNAEEEVEDLDKDLFGDEDFDFDSFIDNPKSSKEEKMEPEFFDKRNLQRLEEMAVRFKD